MYKAVIVDDELDAIESVKLLLNENFPNIEIAGTAQSVTQALEIIPEVLPDIVFLDIEMPDGKGFDVLEHIQNRNFSVIFITAYNQYAIKAFKFSATDYILKPIDIDDFIKAVEKAVKNVSLTNNVEDKINVLLENINGNKPEKIAISTAESIEFVNISDIVQIQAEGSYSVLKFIDNTNTMVSKNLGEFETLLEDHPFYRTHQSHLINLLHVKKVNRLGNEIVMDDGSVAFLSRRKKNQFMEIMSNMVQQKK
jgi:two-component system LytT family response regulator